MTRTNTDSAARTFAISSTIDARFDKPASGWRRRLFTVIFEADTRAGLLFDLALIAVIVTSVLVVILDSVQSIRDQWRPLFNAFEWTFTVLFTLEYIARLACVNKPMRYALSFYGVIDLLALLPTYLVAFAPELAYLIDVRVLRLPVSYTHLTLPTKRIV